MKLDKDGQALIEYLFIFAAFSVISIGAAKGIAQFSSEFFDSFTYHLTQELSVGTCAASKVCWHDNFENR